jgi:hypothetical protein
MSDDRKDEQVAEPQPSDGAPENAPFVPIDDSANFVALSGRMRARMRGAGALSRKDYDQFRQQFFSNCPELAWVRDVADAGKHRGLGRSDVQVREVARTWSPSNTLPLQIILDDGSAHNIADVLRRIAEYFRKTHFPI